MTSSTSSQELKHEITLMKKRISALERAFDSIATKDDLEAIEDAHEDLKRKRTTSLSEVKKKYA